MIFSIINYTIWFLTLGNIIDKLKYNVKKIDFNLIIIILSVILTSLVGIVGAVETRFLMPLYIFAYANAIHACYDIKYKRELVAKNIVRLGFIYIIFIGICFTMSSNTYSNIQGHNVITVKN